MTNRSNPVCPTCGVKNPKHHPCLGYEGECQLCEDPWHQQTADEIRATWPSAITAGVDGFGDTLERAIAERAKR